MMGSHPTWCFVVALSVLCTGTKVQPRQIVYQIRPAPLSAFSSQDGTFLLEDGVTEFQFPSFGLKTQPQAKSSKIFPTTIGTSPASNLSGDSGDVDSSSSSSSSSSSPSEEGSSSVTKEENSEIQQFSTSQPQQIQLGQQFLQLQPEQIQQIFRQFQPQQVQQLQSQQEQQQQQQQQQNLEIGPRYEYRSEESSSNSNSEDIKTAQSEVITEDRLQPAYSERREKRKKKDPPGDASYAFGYETDEAARHEVADPDGNVKGWYTYVDDEGTVRKIIYTAGAGKGFVVLGKEKVRGPKGSSSQSQSQSQSRKYNRPSGSSSRSVNTDFLGFAADTSALNSVKHQKPVSTPAPFTNYVSFNSWNDLAKAGTSNPPVPTTIITTSEPVARTKKPVFIVKIRRPVTKEQFRNAKPFNNPEPLPVPITTKSRTRRRGSMTLSDVVPPSLRKSRIKKYPTPPIYYADDDDDSTSDDTSSTQASSSASSSGEYDNSENDSRERGGGGGLPVKSDPDSSYVFGYETEHSNRLEKADPYGNVRGSYSYIGSSINQLLNRHHSPSYSASHHHHRQHVVDEKKPLSKRSQLKKVKKSLKSYMQTDPEGVKRTVHYIAGGNTGFQVIHASPTISKGVRLEAPPGYSVRRLPSSRKGAPSLRTSESRFPIPISVPQPSAIVYHIHPDSGWRPWEPEPTLKKKKIKIHRKKLPKAVFDNARRDGIFILQSHPDLPAVQNSRSFNSGSTGSTSNSASASSSTYGVSAGNPASGSGAYFKEKITAAGSGAVTSKEAKLPHTSPQVSRRRHAPQRGFTAERHIVEIEDDDDGSHHKHSKSSSSASSSKSQGGSVHEREPLLYSPTYETMRESRMPVPNQIQLQPTQVAIKSRGAPSQTVTAGPGLDQQASNHNPVAFTSDGKLQVEIPTVIIIQEQKDGKRSEAVAPTQTSSSGQQVAGSNKSNYIQGSTPINTSNPSATYQPSSVSAPSPPTTSPSPSIQQQKAQEAPLNNQIPLTQQQQQALPQQTRTRRRHHRSKSSSNGTNPTSSSSSNSASSSNSNSVNAIKNGGGNGVSGITNSGVETTTMSSSKRLINRLAPTDHEATIAAQQ